MGVVREPNINYDGRRRVSSHGAHTPIGITIHDTESHDHSGILDLKGIAVFWERQGLGYGAHIGIDKDANSARYVNDRLVAYHTGGHNTGHLGMELIGFARFTPKMWLARPRQLEKCARWIAYYSKRFDIPIRASTFRGVATHRMFSRQFPQDTNHNDPGAGFPFWLVLRRARYLRAHGWK